jgi:hypothetical protein
MAVITRSAHPDLLWPGVMAIYGNAYNEYPPQWSQIFEKRTSSKAYEKLVETSGFGLAPVKTEGAPIQYDTDAEGVVTTLTPTVYGLGWMATREEIEDGQYPEVSRRRSKALGRSMRTTAEIVHANVFNRGFSGSYLGADGVSLFSTAHPTPAGNQANKMAVDADLTEASLEDALTNIGNALDRRGLPIRLRGMKIVVASGAQFNAERILHSSLRSGTANNDINAVKQMGLLPDGIVVNNYLTDPDAWFIVTDADEGFLSIWRREAAIEQDNDFDTENAKAKSTMRFSTGYGDFRAGFGSQGA